jgi:hypothetical protein
MMVRLMQVTIRMGKHPAVKKRPSAVVMFMRGKEHYTQLKDYCSISLLCCMGKAVEEIVAELQSKIPREEDYCAMDNFGAKTDSQPWMQQPSWSKELTHPA